MNIFITTQFNKTNILHKTTHVLLYATIGFSLMSCEQTPSTDATENTPPISDAVVHPSIPTPINYDTQSWQKTESQPIALSNIEKIVSVFGTPTAVDENSLDYSSLPAIKYRFADNDDPYLDIIDSDKYLEIGWYYANPNDNDKEKALSLNHAKKAYKLAQQLLGSDGSTIVTNMLNGKIIKDKELPQYKISLAKCEFYSCMLIINKNQDNQTQTTEDNTEDKK